jgi:hypothetical protein
MIAWQYYPKSDSLPDHLGLVVRAFAVQEPEIRSIIGNDESGLSSDRVLAAVGTDLLQLGYRVETSKKAADKIQVPVLFGRNGLVEKSFEADAFDPTTGTVLEIEAGRGVVNNAFLKDLFQACMMQDVNYAAIAVRNVYRGSRDFERVISFFDTLYASRRLTLPLAGILIIGY